MTYYVFDTEIGKITIAEKKGAINIIAFGDKKLQYENKKTPLLEKAYLQLKEYFEGKRKVFDLPLAPEGTPFQKRVWQALLEIPYGQTVCYGEIAERTGNKKASRAVGMANNRNPIAIVIPCHRVIGKNGSLTGYGGGLDIKEKLLNIERENSL